MISDVLIFICLSNCLWHESDFVLRMSCAPLRCYIQTRFEIDKVIAAFEHFSPYVRRLAEGGGTLGAQPDIDSQDGIVGRAEGTATTPLEGRGKSIPLEIFGDFVAHMLQCGEELRVKKVDIVLQVQGIDNTIPVTY